MRDGALICVGLGKPDWNYSAPHGAGRSRSREDSRKTITLTQFREDMKGIYSSSINKSAIDESPRAYKDPDKIISQIGEAVKIVSRIRPIYNFKAGGEE